MDGAYVINHNDTERKGTHWVSLRFTKIQLYSLIEYITQEALSKIIIIIIIIKNLTHNIFRMQDDDNDIMSGFYLYCFNRIYDCRKNFVRKQHYLPLKYI